MLNPDGHDRRRIAGFTLVELMVVIAIVAMLMSLLLPALSKARQAGRKVVCQSQIRQYGLAVHVYASDYRNRLIPQRWLGNSLAAGTWHNWALPLSVYLDQRYGSPSDHTARHYSSGLTAQAGTVHACPEERYLAGVPGDLPSTIPEAGGQIGYGNFGTVVPGKHYWTTYALNRYATRRDGIAYTGNENTDCAWSRPPAADGLGNELARIEQKQYPSSLWMIGESYVHSPNMWMAASALTRSKHYTKVNFERHGGSVNIAHLDGHVINISLGSKEGIIASPNDNPLSESVVRGYKHWGINHNSSTGW